MYLMNYKKNMRGLIESKNGQIEFVNALGLDHQQIIEILDWIIESVLDVISKVKIVQNAQKRDNISSKQDF